MRGFLPHHHSCLCRVRLADNYSEAVPRLLAGLKGPRLGLIGPWAHSYPYDVTVEPAIGWLQEVLRWCDHWMKGRDTGIMNEPMLRAWMQESVLHKPATGNARAAGLENNNGPRPISNPKSFTSIPPAGLVISRKQRQQLSICSPLWVGLAAGEVGRYGGEADWPTDQREDDAGSLVFITEPLPKEWKFGGTAA